MKIPIANPVNELKTIKNFDSKFLTQVMKGVYVGGKNVTDYENKLQKFLDCQYIASCNSGTDALILSI